MHEVPLLINIALALVVAFIGGMLARRMKLPTIFGYLLAGISIGPFTPGYIGDIETVSQLAELGVIFLMFGVGLHFSFRDLWRVRDIAVPGALAQTFLATLLGIGLTQIWDWPIAAGIVTGLAISVASTVVLLRGLMNTSLLNTTHGQAAVGWLVAEVNRRVDRRIRGGSASAMDTCKPTRKSSTLFEMGDRIGLAGEPEQIEAASALVAGKEADIKQPGCCSRTDLSDLAVALAVAGLRRPRSMPVSWRS